VEVLHNNHSGKNPSVAATAGSRLPIEKIVTRKVVVSKTTPRLGNSKDQ